MKRGFDEVSKATNHIKIPDASSIALATKQQNSSVILTRQIIDMPQQPVASAAAAGQGGAPQGPTQGTQPAQQQNPAITIAAAAAHLAPQQTVSRLPSAGGSSVSVFRGADPSSAGGGPAPPAAHSGVSLTAPGARSSTQPAPPAHISQGQTTVVAQQPQANLKPETIALPTTPVSLRRCASFSGSNTLPQSVKNLTSGATQVTTQSVGLVHTLSHQQSVAHHQQQIHQKAGVSFGPPTTIRTVNVSSILPTMPTPSTTAVISTPVSASAINIAQSIATTVAQQAAAVAAATPLSAGGPTAAAAAAAAAAAGSASFQGLEVEGALSYLDQVKYKFDNQPQVYNDFLDIMKEFKTQSIDTPGVIARVSCLFRGHPELIVGFNTFLPTGYKVEVHKTSDSGVNMSGIAGGGMQTIVHTPHGIHTMGATGHMSAITTAASNLLAQQPTLQIRQTPLTQAQPKIAYATPTQAKITTGASVTSEPVTASQFRAAAVLPPAAHVNVPTAVSHLPSRAGDAHPQLTLSQPHLAAAAAAVAAGTPQVHPHLPTHPHPPPPPHASAGAPPMHQAANQPEFNHAINYVNKIKNRFQGQPDVYKQFLEILHTYQRDQKAIKDGHVPTGKYLTEAEVHGQVSKLFQNQHDLLQEFGQFLPEATDHAVSGLTQKVSNEAKKQLPGSNFGFQNMKYMTAASQVVPGGLKRPASGLSQPPPKKPKMPGVIRDVSLAEASKYGTLKEFAFFDKVRTALKNQEVYDNFLRCLVLFNQEVISRADLVQLTSTFLSRHPELFKWFKDFLGYKEGHGASADGAVGGAMTSGQVGGSRGFSGDASMEIDYATCKRLGKSYCALPKDYPLPICSGRNDLCQSVLNDTWVSFPSWSEDSQFVTSRGTQYEEYIYRTEDERFEFDIVLETNKDTIRVLGCVQKKMSRMPPEEAARYRLDDCLGGSSPTIHQRAIRRIYGDKSGDIIEGLKRNPVVAVPLVLRRLRSKDEEWREVQKNFNKVWRDQNERFYLKSLDHQFNQFKQSDTRSLRSKSLLNEIETLYDERHEQQDEHSAGTSSGPNASGPAEGPHITIEYSDAAILDDANNILIHHVKRQTSIHKEDKQKIKLLLRHFLMDLFKHQRQDLSEDERDDANENDDSSNNESDTNAKSTRSDRARKKRGAAAQAASSANDSDSKRKNGDSKKNDKLKEELTEADIKIENKDGRKTPLHAREMDPDESYVHIMCNNHWYLFIRLHQILCERLTKMYNQAVVIASEETKDKKDRKESTAVALRLKPKNEIEPEDYYPAFLDMVKNLLDGNMEAQAYEDTLREMFGIHAYVSFTLDKVVGNAVRQLQNLVTEDTCVECYELFNSESKNNATGGYCGTAPERQIAELLYQKKAEKLLADEGCMKVFVYHQSSKVTIEMLDTETEGQNTEPEEETRKYNSYVDRFIQPGHQVSEECKAHLSMKPVFLPRSVRSYNTSPYGKIRSQDVDDLPIVNGEGSSMKKEIKKEDDDAATDEDAKKDKEGDRLTPVNTGDVLYEDNTQCIFNPKSLKMLYVINSENCFYRKLALTRGKLSHKAVSRRKTSDFNKWHSKWVKQNVSETQKTSVDEWFMGKCEGLVPNKTHRVIKADQDKTPYRTYYKFKSDILKTTSTAAAAPAEPPTTSPSASS